MPSESEADTVTADSIAIQVIQENADLSQKYAGGDMSVFDALQKKAQALAAGRVSEHELKDTLVRKLGASY